MVGVLLILFYCMGWGYRIILGGVKRMFSSHTKFELGDGSKIKLWDDG
jgi:hypothetical protein